MGFPSCGQLEWVVASLGLYFGLRLLFSAFSISHYVPPGEVTHLDLPPQYSICHWLKGPRSSNGWTARLKTRAITLYP